MRPYLQLLPAALFLGLVCMPLTLTMFGVDPSAPLEEYRQLARFPDVNKVIEGNEPLEAFFRKMSVWHSDNFPTRPFWIRLRSQWLFSIFNESDKVYVGDDGWLFYRSVIDHDLPLVEKQTDADIQKSVARFRHLTDLLSEDGITLYVIPIPLKDFFYREKLPLSASHVLEYRKIDYFIDALARDKHMNLVDVRPLLLEAKRKGLKIFHKTDFHWTDPPGGIVGRHLLRLMADKWGQNYDPNTVSYDIVPLKNMSGGQARFLPLFATPQETSVQASNIRPMRQMTQEIDKDGVEFQAELVEPPENILPPVIIFADSFFYAFEQTGFQFNFQAYVRGRRGKNTLSAVYDARPEQTKFMIIEFIAVSWPDVDNSVAELIAKLEASKLEATTAIPHDSGSTSE